MQVECHTATPSMVLRYNWDPLLSRVIFSNIFPQCSQIMADQITSMQCSIGKCGQCEITLFCKKMMSVKCQIDKKYVLGLRIVINRQYLHFKQSNIFHCTFIQFYVYSHNSWSLWQSLRICLINLILQHICSYRRTLLWPKGLLTILEVHSKSS